MKSFVLYAGRNHSLSVLVRKEGICVLRLVFPVGKSIKMLFKLNLDFGKNRKIFMDVYTFKKGNNRNSLMAKAALIRHKLLLSLNLDICISNHNHTILNQKNGNIIICIKRIVPIKNTV